MSQNHEIPFDKMLIYIHHMYGVMLNAWYDILKAIIKYFPSFFWVLSIFLVNKTPLNGAIFPIDKNEVNSSNFTILLQIQN